MKKISVFMATFMLVILSSCSNEEIASDVSSLDDSVLIYETVFDLLGVQEAQSLDYFDTKAAAPIVSTAFGADEQTVIQSNQKGRFGTELANLLGVSANTIYVFDKYKMTKSIVMGNRYFINYDSPKCGLTPLSSSNQIGYASSVLDGKFVMNTYLIHIKTDMSGRNINKWGPRTASSLEWNYAYFE